MQKNMQFHYVEEYRNKNKYKNLITVGSREYWLFLWKLSAIFYYFYAIFDPNNTNSSAGIETISQIRLLINFILINLMPFGTEACQGLYHKYEYNK